MVEEGKLNMYTVSLFDLECLTHSNDVPNIILVTLLGIESKDASSSSVLKDCILLLQVALNKIQDVAMVSTFKYVSVHIMLG